MKGRLYIELINGPFLVRDLGSVAEYGAGLRLLIERKQLAMHKSGTFVWLPDGDLPVFDAHEKQAKLIQHLLADNFGRRGCDAGKSTENEH